MKTIFYELFAILALTTSVSRSWARIVYQHEENWEQLFKKEIKSSILKQLNVFESPSKSNFTVANLKSFTERFNDEEQDEKIQLIITAEKVTNDSQSTRFIFQIKPDAYDGNNVITEARLSLFVKQCSTESNITTTFIKDGSDIISTMLVPADYNGWIDFDISKAFQKWTAQKSFGRIFKNVSFIQNGCHQNRELAIEQLYFPYVTISIMKRKAPPRQRRKSWTCNVDSSCCSRPIFLTFEELSWNWVLSPKGFWTNKCMGNCKKTTLHNNCCVPKELSSITLFYHDADYNLYRKKIESIIVKDCGCI